MAGVLDSKILGGDACEPRQLRSDSCRDELLYFLEPLADQALQHVLHLLTRRIQVIVAEVTHPLVATLEHLDQFSFEFRDTVIQMNEGAAEVIGDLTSISKQLHGAVRGSGVELFGVINHATNRANFGGPRCLPDDAEAERVDG